MYQITLSPTIYTFSRLLSMPSTERGKPAWHVIGRRRVVLTWELLMCRKTFHIHCRILTQSSCCTQSLSLCTLCFRDFAPSICSHFYHLIYWICHRKDSLLQNRIERNGGGFILRINLPGEISVYVFRTLSCISHVVWETWPQAWSWLAQVSLDVSVPQASVKQWQSYSRPGTVEVFLHVLLFYSKQ